MATKSTEPMKSLYTFTDARSMTQTLAQRWWMDPKVAYLHRRDADVERIPLLSKTSKNYPVAKLAGKNQHREHVKGLSQVAKRGQH
jgi:hypothetical protein